MTRTESSPRQAKEFQLPPRLALINRRFLMKTPTNNPLWLSHAQVPTVLPLHADLWRIYVAGRDRHNRARVFVADFEPATLRVTHIHPKPVLDLGTKGAFDENGVGPGAAVFTGDRIRLYYSGVAARSEVPYRAGIGIAESTDNGLSFHKLDPAPALGGEADGLFGAATPTIMRETDGWSMWYSRFLDWRRVNGKLEPIYDIGLATSEDGLNWTPAPKPALSLSGEHEGGLVRAHAMSIGGRQILIAGARGWQDFRAGGAETYHFILAEETGQGGWKRLPGRLDPEKVETNGWDNDMRCYPHPIQWRGKTLLFYNGNNFGRDGFGVAELLWQKEIE